MVRVKIDAASLLPTAHESGASLVKMSTTNQQQTALVIAYPTSPEFEVGSKHSVKYTLDYPTTFVGQAQGEKSLVFRLVFMTCLYLSIVCILSALVCMCVGW